MATITVKITKAINAELLREEVNAAFPGNDGFVHRPDHLEFFVPDGITMMQAQLEALVGAHDARKQSTTEQQQARDVATVKAFLAQTSDDPVVRAVQAAIRLMLPKV